MFVLLAPDCLAYDSAVAAGWSQPPGRSPACRPSQPHEPLCVWFGRLAGDVRVRRRRIGADGVRLRDVAVVARAEDANGDVLVRRLTLRGADCAPAPWARRPLAAAASSRAGHPVQPSPGPRSRGARALRQRPQGCVSSLPLLPELVERADVGVVHRNRGSRGALTRAIGWRVRILACCTHVGGDRARCVGESKDEGEPGDHRKRCPNRPSEAFSGSKARALSDDRGLSRVGPAARPRRWADHCAGFGAGRASRAAASEACRRAGPSPRRRRGNAPAVISRRVVGPAPAARAGSRPSAAAGRPWARAGGSNRPIRGAPNQELGIGAGISACTDAATGMDAAITRAGPAARRDVPPTGAAGTSIRSVGSTKGP